MTMAPTSSDTTAAAAISRLRNTHNGSTGSAARRSTTTNTTSSTATTANMVTLVADDQAQAWPPSSRARISTVSAAVSRAAPTTSIRCVRRCRVSWKDRRNIHHATRQSGMLTKKIQRQEMYSLNSPPSSGPTTADMPQTLAR